MDFRCPTCHCLEYQRFVAVRPDGSKYATEFFFCLGCTTLFIEPELYTAAKMFRAPVGKASEAHQVSLDTQALQYRYWRTKVKRERGGGEPTQDQVIHAKLARS